MLMVMTIGRRDAIAAPDASPAPGGMDTDWIKRHCGGYHCTTAHEMDGCLGERSDLKVPERLWVATEMQRCYDEPGARKDDIRAALFRVAIQSDPEVAAAVKDVLIAIGAL